MAEVTVARGVNIMRVAVLGLLAVSVIVTLSAAYPPGNRAAKEENIKLWAAVSVSQPVVNWDADAAPPFMIHFGLVNDGDKPVNPAVESSQLLINGKALKDWEFIVSNGLRAQGWNLLPPGESLLFGYNMGRYFQDPGVYKVAWKGAGFQAPDVVFRVMPRKKD
jgi:hypothetical protein